MYDPLFISEWYESYGASNRDQKFREYNKKIQYHRQTHCDVRKRFITWADPEGGRCPHPSPLIYYKHIGFLSNTGPHALKNHEATKPALNVRSSSARQRIAILMAFYLRAGNDPLLVVIGSCLPLSTKKRCKS